MGSRLPKLQPRTRLPEPGPLKLDPANPATQNDRRFFEVSSAENYSAVLHDRSVLDFPGFQSGGECWRAFVLATPTPSPSRVLFVEAAKHAK